MSPERVLDNPSVAADAAKRPSRLFAPVLWKKRCDLTRLRLDGVTSTSPMWMLWRMRHIITAAAFLCGIVLRFQPGVASWVFFPFIATGAFLVFCEYLYRTHDRAMATALVGKAILLLLVYSLIFVIVPWLRVQFPETLGSLKSLQTVTDVKVGIGIEPCLASVQTAVRRYNVESERAQGAQIESDLNGILERARQGQDKATSAAQEQAVRDQIRQLAQHRAEWLTVLSVCDGVKTTPTSGTAAQQAEPRAPKAATTTATTRANVTTASRRTEESRYLTDATPGETFFVFAQSTDPAIETEVTASLQSSSGLFTPAFFQDGLFARVFAGDFGVLDQLQLASVSKLFACQSSSRFIQAEDAGMRRSEIRLTCRRLDLDGRTSRLFDASGVGIGYTEDSAFRLGVKHVVDSFKSQLQQP